MLIQDETLNTFLIITIYFIISAFVMPLWCIINDSLSLTSQLTGMLISTWITYQIITWDYLHL